MRFVHILVLMAAFALVAPGCAEKDTPGGAVVDFLDAVRGADVAVIEKSLSFEKLYAEMAGPGYAGLTPEQRQAEVAAFKKNMINGLMSGKLKVLGEIDPRVVNERISGDSAEVTVNNRKTQGASYVFALTREGGVWKIHRIKGV